MVLHILLVVWKLNPSASSSAASEMDTTLPQSLLIMWKTDIPVLVDLLSGNCRSLRSDQDLHHFETKEQAIWIESSIDGAPLELTVYAKISREFQSTTFTYKSELKPSKQEIPSTPTRETICLGSTKRLSQVPCFSSTGDCRPDIRPLFDHEQLQDRSVQLTSNQEISHPVKLHVNDFNSSNCTYLGSFMDSFLLCHLRTGEGKEMISLVDQHALHERIRLEELWKGLWDCRNRLKSTSVVPSLLIEMPSCFCSQLSQYEEQLSRLGLQFVPNETSLNITHVPTVLKDKHQRDPDRTSLRNDISVLIHQAVEIFTEATTVAPIVSAIVMDWVATAACRGAIMFGDKLPESEVDQLLSAARRTSLPFQCAHGRPSVLPIALLLPPSVRNQKVCWEKLRQGYLPDPLNVRGSF